MTTVLACAASSASDDALNLPDKFPESTGLLRFPELTGFSDKTVSADASPSLPESSGMGEVGNSVGSKCKLSGSLLTGSEVSTCAVGLTDEGVGFGAGGSKIVGEDGEEERYDSCFTNFAD